MTAGGSSPRPTKMRKRTGFTTDIRETLLAFKANDIGLGEAIRRIKNRAYQDRDEFIYQGRLRNAIDHAIMVERKEL